MTKTTAIGTGGRRPIIVGVDGSISANGALAWAASAASSRRCPLRIIHTFTLPMLGSALELPGTGNLALELRSAAEWILTEAELYARDIARDIRITRELFIAGAAPTLLSQAHDAELVVLGSRGVGGFRGLRVGSVSATVTAHAPCPVVVVHPHRYGTAFPAFPKSRVVVGVDGSDVSAAAIRFAYQEAVRRHVGLTAVHALLPARHHSSSRISADVVEQLEQQLFAAALENKRVLGPSVDLELKLAHSHPARALIDQSDRAELLVVGARGRGGFPGMLLGSVSQAVLQHAGCPVAIVHPQQVRSHTSRPTARPAKSRSAVAAASVL